MCHIADHHELTVFDSRLSVQLVHFLCLLQRVVPGAGDEDIVILLDKLKLAWGIAAQKSMPQLKMAPLNSFG